MSVYQHWDPLKTCMVGKSYPPEFYSWIKDPKARTAMERIAQETEEDYQSLLKILHSFGVKTIRPEVSGDHEEYFNPYYNHYVKSPMTPRDETGTFGDNFIVQHRPDYKQFYNNVKDPSWPDIKSLNELKNLPQRILLELQERFNLDYEVAQFTDVSYIDAYINALDKNNINYNVYHDDIIANTASVCRVGKDLYYPNEFNHSKEDIKNVLGNNYRINFYNGSGHSDGCFCPVVPGLIVSLKGYLEYKETFPDWEVVELPEQSWSKVSPFLKLKDRNNGKWWVPGEEGNNALTECVENWLDNWVGYVEETVFDINMLVVDEKNVICNNYNKKVFDAFERYGVTPHVCNFRHRYFWDGGIHCITADIEREGTLKDYFPERN